MLLWVGLSCSAHTSLAQRQGREDPGNNVRPMSTDPVSLRDEVHKVALSMALAFPFPQ